MKLNKLSLAMGVAVLASAGSANAFNPGVTSPDFEMVMSGASASSDLVLNLIIDDICSGSGGIDYLSGSDSSGWAVACNVTAGQVPGLSSSANILFRKRNSGGSGLGVMPVIDALPLPFTEISTGGGSNCGTAPSGTDSTGAGTSYNVWSCGTAKEDATPVGGFSDIEPSKFFGINKPVVDIDGDGTDDVPEFTDRGNFAVRPLAGLVFGVPVTRDLRNALQQAQGLTVDSDTEADMPSLSAQVIRSMYTGAIKKWDQLTFDVGGVQTPLTDIVTPSSDKGSDKVHICRRVNGSGTQAQSNAIFLNWPCEAGAVKPLIEPGFPSTGPIVFQNSGSSDVGRCLDDFNNGTNASGKNVAIQSGPFVLADANRQAWAIGIQSTEKNAGNSRDYRFIKVDGVAPTVQNVHGGTYFDFAEQSMQWRTSAAQNGTAGATADQALIFEDIAANATGATPVANLNTNFAFVGGWQGGWLAVPGTGSNVADADFSLSNPVNTVTRSPFGNSPNTCQFPVNASSSISGDK